MLITAVMFIAWVLSVSEEWDILPVVSADQGVGDTSLADSWNTGGVWTSQLVDRTQDTKVPAVDQSDFHVCYRSSSQI